MRLQAVLGPDARYRHVRFVAVVLRPLGDAPDRVGCRPTLADGELKWRPASSFRVRRAPSVPSASTYSWSASMRRAQATASPFRVKVLLLSYAPSRAEMTALNLPEEVLRIVAIAVSKSRTRTAANRACALIAALFACLAWRRSEKFRLLSVLLEPVGGLEPPTY